jgi:S-DNA-T family DNA segregation ATPase FtsK/SpoIIIE
LADPAVRTLKVKDKFATSRELFSIKPREQGDLPEQTVEIPSPSSPLPQAPGQLNMLSMILPPVIMMVASGVMIAFMVGSGASSGTWVFYLMAPIMGIGMPLASFISHKNQQKKYAEAVQVREHDYRKKLQEARSTLDELASRQREVLGRDYPLLPRLTKIVLDRSHRKRLWWRRMADPDFLSLRMGTGYDHPTFSVTPPRMMSPDDPLSRLAQETLEAYKEIPQLPVLLDLKTVGSVGLVDRNGSSFYGFARKIVLDVIVHHSPQDVQVVVLGDTREAQERWEWLKWTPHTRAIYQVEPVRRLAFDVDVADKTIEWLVKEFDNRTRSESGIRRSASRSSIVVLLDDSSMFRRLREIGRLAEAGKSAGIYLIFIGKKDLPKECRAKIDLSEDGFNYMEMFAGERGGAKKHGEVETASMADCERIARALAGLEISAGEAASVLPETVRLFEMLEPDGQVSRETIDRNWKIVRKDSELLQFPFGLQFDRKGLKPATLNLLPDKYSGFGSYHTILVGTTGSGKSEFMKSLILSSAYKYSPRILNFFLMDFKGGTAFNVLKDLPHVVGIVTNLNPLLVERALVSIKTEVDRRLRCFESASVKDVWEYNAKYIRDPLPHLLLVLDEFSLGMNDFPALPLILADLVRGGRALGMYLFLANQDVNPAVDRLLPNVGWRIALKLANQEDMHIIDRSRPKMEKTGRGYLHAQSGDISEFQAAFVGSLMADPGEIVEDTFRIYEVEAAGRWQPMYSNARRPSSGDHESRRPKEQDFLISAMKGVSNEVEAAPRIYLEPLEPEISLEEVLQDSEIQRIFMDGEWLFLSKPDKGRLVAPIGYTDSIEERVQAPLQIDFEDQDGHLWLIGAAASGKAMTIETVLLSLALTNTPEDAWFYLIDFGAMGRLQHLSSLPHCGAYITPKKPAEMVDRLFRFLDGEMERRMDKGKRRDIFLVINNFSEFRSQYPDHVERLPPYINNGKAAGIHLIISTNRRADLLNKMAIARRIVLRLTNRDEYSDAVGGRVSVLPVLQTEGRGLWVDGKPIECQVAHALSALKEDGELVEPENACEELSQMWRGSLPPRIQTLSAQIPLTELLEQIEDSNPDEIPIPVGVSFENMQPVIINLLRELPRWLVLGPPRSGKSNFLNSIVEAVHRIAPDLWDVRYVSLRRPLPGMKDGNAKGAFSVAEATQMVDEIINGFDAPTKPGKKLLLLLDDLGSFFEPGREALAGAWNNLALKASTRDDVFIIGAGLPDELRPHQGLSRLVQSLKQNKTGIVFSKEPGDFDLIGIQLPIQYRRMDLNPGRGFWCSGGKPVLIQSPWSGK